MQIFEVLLLVAAVLCGVAGAIRLSARSWDGACVAFAVGCIALAFINLF